MIYENEAESFREAVFASGSLGAINYVIRGMNDLPGRKSIIYLSSGLSLYDRDSRGNPRESRIYDSLRRLVDLANRASVVFYTVDVRGVVFEGLTAEDNVNGLTNEQIEERLHGRSDELRDSQAGLIYLSKATGGFSYFLNNIGNGIRKVMEDQSYYLVGYEPDESTFDPKNVHYNSLTVKVSRPGARVRFRRGFYGVSEQQVQLALDKTPATQKLYNALTSPFGVNDISLRMNSVFITDAKRNSYMRSFLHVDPTNLTFTSSGPNSHKTTFDLLAATFGDQGIPVDGFRTGFTLDLSDEAFKKAQQKGLVYDFDFPIKKAGAYQMRIAIRDAASNKVGSANQFVQVPNLNKNRLTLSGVLVNAVSLDTWKKLDTMKPEEAIKVLNPKSDTALRQFTVGSVLNYEATVYNAKRDAGGKIGLTVQAKLYRDLDVVFDGKPTAIPVSDPSSDIVAKGSLMLGADLIGGNYTLQVTVTDNTGEKPRLAYQFLPFEIIR